MSPVVGTQPHPASSGLECPRPGHDPENRTWTNAKAQWCQDARISAAEHHRPLGESFSLLIFLPIAPLPLGVFALTAGSPPPTRQPDAFAISTGGSRHDPNARSGLDLAHSSNISANRAAKVQWLTLVEAHFTASLREKPVEALGTAGRAGVAELPVAVGPGDIGRNGLPEDGRRKVGGAEHHVG